MLSLFRTNLSFAGFLLFGYALLLQLPALLLGPPPPPPDAATHYGDLLTGWAAGQPFLSALLPAVLLAVAGMLANGLCARNRFAQTTTQFPGLLLILVWGLVPSFHAFSAMQFGHLLLLLATGALGSTYKSQNAPVARFNAGWWLGVASLLVPAYLFFLLPFIVGVSILGTINLRTVSQLLTGCLLAYFLGGTAAFVGGAWTAFLTGQLTGFGLSAFAGLTVYDGVGLAALLLCIFVVLMAAAGPRTLLSIEGSKNNAFVYWILLFTPLVALTMEVTSAAAAQVAVPPLGILLGLWLARQPDRRAEFYHLLAFALAILLLFLRLGG